MSCAGATGRQIDDHIDLLRYPLRYPHARLRWTGHVHRRVGGVKGVRLSESCRRHRQPFQRHDSGVSNVARPAPRETAGASGQCSTSAHRSRFSHAALARSSFSSLHFALCLSGPLQSSYSSKYPGQYAVAVHDDLHVHVPYPDLAILHSARRVDFFPDPPRSRGRRSLALGTRGTRTGRSSRVGRDPRAWILAIDFFFSIYRRASACRFSFCGVVRVDCCGLEPTWFELRFLLFCIKRSFVLHHRPRTCQ